MACLRYAACRYQKLRYGHATRCGRKVWGLVRCVASSLACLLAFFLGRVSWSAGAAACVVSLAPLCRPLDAPCGACFARLLLASSVPCPQTLCALAPNCVLRLDPAIYMSSLHARPAPLAALAPHPASGLLLSLRSRWSLRESCPPACGYVACDGNCSRPSLRHCALSGSAPRHPMLR